MLLLAALFTLWTLWFWLVFVAVTILIIWFDNFEKTGRAFTTMLLFLLGVAWFNPAIAEHIQLHPLSLVAGVLVYIAIGVVWMFVRWLLFLTDVRAAMTEKKGLETNNRVYRAGDGPKAFVLTVRGRPVSYPVKVQNHRLRIIGWATYWPWSAFWTMLDLLFHRVFQHLYTMFAGRLQRMADKITGGDVP